MKYRNARPGKHIPVEYGMIKPTEAQWKIDTQSEMGMGALSFLSLPFIFIFTLSSILYLYSYSILILFFLYSIHSYPFTLFFSYLL